MNSQVTSLTGKVAWSWREWSVGAQTRDSTGASVCQSLTPPKAKQSTLWIKLQSVSQPQCRTKQGKKDGQLYCKFKGNPKKQQLPLKFLVIGKVEEPGKVCLGDGGGGGGGGGRGAEWGGGKRQVRVGEGGKRETGGGGRGERGVGGGERERDREREEPLENHPVLPSNILHHNHSLKHHSIRYFHLIRIDHKLHIYKN